MSRKTLKVIIKLSGESFRDKKTLFNYEYLTKVVLNLIKFQLNNNCKIIIIIGGGNIWRGAERHANFLQYDADYMGMFATVINGLFLKNIFMQNKIKAKICSNLEINNIKGINSFDKLKKLLDGNSNFFIIVGGTGLPYCTTDMLTIKLALQTKSTMILFSKNGVDGVYKHDPRITKQNNNYKYTKMSFDEYIKNKLSVIKLESIKLLKNDKEINLFLFNANKPENINKINDVFFPGTKISYSGK